ncbi:MAG: hypothetical protein AB1673_12345 [Actinomycetota bacterium]
MADEEQAWAEMAAQGGGGTTTMSPPTTSPPAMPPPSSPPPEQAQAQAAPVQPESGKRRKKEKAPKAPKEARARAPRSSGGPMAEDKDWVLSLSEDGPSRQELEQMAAAELFAALAPSYDLLHAEVPDAASPDDAVRKIESKLGPAPSDTDADLPSHPIWQGDALVYQQLKRHYGRPHQGSSFKRSWYPLSGG